MYLCINVNIFLFIHCCWVIWIWIQTRIQIICNTLQRLSCGSKHECNANHFGVKRNRQMQKCKCYMLKCAPCKGEVAMNMNQTYNFCQKTSEDIQTPALKGIRRIIYLDLGVLET